MKRIFRLNCLILAVLVLTFGSISMAQENQEKKPETTERENVQKQTKKGKGQQKKEKEEQQTTSDQVKGEKKESQKNSDQEVNESGESKKKVKRPSGWDHGEKEGWRESDVPPGWEKWDEAKQKGWEKELDEAKQAIRTRSESGKMRSKAEIDSAMVAMEAAARKGVPVKDVKSVVDKGLEKGLKGRELEMTTRAMASGVRKGIDMEKLAQFTNQKIDKGVQGDDLSDEIYNEIQNRHDNRVKAGEMPVDKQQKKTKRWWEFWK